MMRLFSASALFSLSLGLAVVACDSGGDGGASPANDASNDVSGGDTAGAVDTGPVAVDSQGGQVVTIPAGFPQLEAGEEAVVVALIGDEQVRFASDKLLGRGYLLTYGELFEEVGGTRRFTVLGLAALKPGVYDYATLSVSVEDGSDLLVSRGCDDPYEPAKVEIVGAEAGTIWGTISGFICDADTHVSLASQFSAHVGETIEAEEGSCTGTAFCDTTATYESACISDAPGCAWTPGRCVGSKPVCETYSWSDALCEDESGCTYFEPTCSGTLLIQCADLTTSFGCGSLDGCVWIAD